MEGLARRQAEQDRLRRGVDGAAARIADRLGSLAAETRVDYAPAGRSGASLAHLVAWKDADAYHAVMAELREAIPDYRLHVVGPWPPWSFVE
jgi:glycosyltransferase involved in cell wall biosynthesis